MNGNIVPTEKTKEVDGNKPEAAAKKAPRRGRTSTGGPRRRRPQAKDKGENQTGVEKNQLRPIIVKRKLKKPLLKR